ncbi:MAG: hypothetical protein EBS93_01885 [Chitinophagia bacterium]|nr:hypothetical protein [Chitinophagia bacterium]NCA29454.1 hypothetical protein [Chitinophagia bacterium]
MKRVFTIFLVLLYAVASMGATATTHLCAGKVKTCKCGKPSKKDLCCSEKTVYLKSQDNHHFQASTNTIVKKLSLNATHEIVAIQKASTALLNSRPFISNKNLVNTGPPIYKFICVYLI